MAKIGVLVPVYNVEKYIAKCIDSILAQTHREFELLLIDDGSSDKSGRICDDYAATDARIEVIHQENRGVAYARNRALDWAVQHNCAWFAFVDSDDTIAQDYLEKLLLLAERKGAQIASCKIAIAAADETNRTVVEKPYEELVLSGQSACEEVYKIGGRTVVSCPGKLINASLFDGVRFPEGKIHEDEAIIPQVMYRAQHIAVTTEPLYFYFQSENSIMRSSFHVKRFQALEAMDTCICFFEEKGEKAIVELAVRRRTVMHTLSILLAKQHGILHQVPDDYRISVFRALCRMHQCTSYDEFTWHLGKFYPKLVKPYSYIWRVCSIIKR